MQVDLFDNETRGVMMVKGGRLSKLYVCLMLALLHMSRVPSLDAVGTLGTLVPC